MGRIDAHAVLLRCQHGCVLISKLKMAATAILDFIRFISCFMAQQGGNVAKVARKELEARTGKKVVTSINAKSVLQLKEGKKKKKKK